MTDSQRYPFLDAYGIFPSHRKIEADGTVWSQDPPQGVALRVQTAALSDVFLAPERPWEEDSDLGIVALLHEEGRYRLWYHVTPPDAAGRGFICYAESDDGFAWQRPELGRVDYSGSAANNILCAAADHPLGFVFLDPSAPPAERYKAIAPRGRYYRDGQHDPTMDKQRFKELLAAMDLGGVPREERRRRIEIRQAVHGAVSADGLTWRNLDEPLLDVGNTALDTHNLCTYDVVTGRYVAYLRGHLDRRRLVRRAEGEDFRHLGQPRPCLMCDPQDPLDDDIYNSCYCPYPGLPSRHLMFPSIYHRIDSIVDIQLAASRDGSTWLRPERRPIVERWIDGEEFGCLYASPQLVALDEEWRLPVGVHRHRHDFRNRGETYPPDSQLRWARWQPDRLVALQAAAEGRVTLVERPLSGGPMTLNYRTEPDGWVCVELVEPPHTPPQPVDVLPGCGLDAADPLVGDELERMVTWRGSGDLSALAGREVSVRLHLKRAQVFCLSL